MTLTQLKYFQTVCRFGNITQASDYLHISQPSVTAAIKDLEKEFKVTLFTRQHRGMTLTKEGSVFLEQADSLLEHADQVYQIMNDLGQGRRVLRIGIPPMIGALLLPCLYHDFFCYHPEIQVHVVEAGRHELTRLLMDNQLDVLFLSHQTPWGPEFKSVLVASLETVCCLPAGHRLAKRDYITVWDLAEEPLILFKTSFFHTETLMARFEEAGITPKILFHTNQLSTMGRLISDNLAIGFLFRQLAQSTRNAVSVPLQPPLPVQVSLVWKSGGYLFGSMNDLINYVKNTDCFSHSL